MKALLAALLLFAAGPAAALEIDLELVLAIDISGSIDPEEAKLQREGYVAAFEDPELIRAMTDGMHGRIAVAYFEWASAWQQRLVVDWTLIDGKQASLGFAKKLGEVPIIIGQRTSISGAIGYALPMFGRKGYQATRRVIDISGDGPNNDGDFIWTARELAAAAGVTVNGLAIINDRPNRWGFPTSPDLDLYYEACVITGPGAFVIVARDFQSFGEAVKKKLLLEVAGKMPPARPKTLRALTDPRRNIHRIEYAPGCDIGERQSREFWQRRFGPD